MRESTILSIGLDNAERRSGLAGATVIPTALNTVGSVGKITIRPSGDDLDPVAHDSTFEPARAGGARPTWRLEERSWDE